MCPKYRGWVNIRTGRLRGSQVPYERKQISAVLAVSSDRRYPLAVDSQRPKSDQLPVFVEHMGQRLNTSSTSSRSRSDMYNR